jgi:hypothetical protein
MEKFFLLILVFILMAACWSGDPPLLTTPLPNGYALDSNGGYYGYIKAPDGKRMTDHFGILDNGTEAWCEEFAWQEDTVACKLQGTNQRDVKKYEAIGFFIIDTTTGEITKFKTDKAANRFWKEKFGNPLPKMKATYRITKNK